MTDDGALAVTWDDGSTDVHRLAALRKACPCAQCGADARDRGPAFIPLYTRDALTLQAVTPVGSYAIQLSWGDGHMTGIYTYAYLKELAAAS